MPKTWLWLVKSHTVECHYNAVQYRKILHKSLQELRQNINWMLDPQKTPHSSPWWVSYGVSFVNMCEKIDHIIMPLHCICYEYPSENLATMIISKAIMWSGSSKLIKKVASNLSISKSAPHQQPGPTPLHLPLDPTVGSFEIHGGSQYWENVVWNAVPVNICEDLQSSKVTCPSDL